MSATSSPRTASYATFTAPPVESLNGESHTGMKKQAAQAAVESAESEVAYINEELDPTPFAHMGFDEKLSLASAFVKSAMKGRRIRFRNNKSSMYWMAVYYNRWYRNLITAVAVLHMALALVEPASNMNSASKEASQWEVETRPIEAFILLVYLADIAIKMRFMGVREYFISWNKMEFLCTMCFALDIVIPVSSTGGLQFSRILRPFFIVTKRKHIRFIFTGICYSIPRMLPVLLLLVFGIIGFALTATMTMTRSMPAFSDLAANNTAFPPYCSAFARGSCEDLYQSFATSFYHLFVLVARANWPLSMLPFYSRTEWAGIFFAVFLLVGHFFLWRLLLAVSFASFADHCRDQYTSQQRRSRAAFKAAFELLSHRGYMDAASFRQLAAKVRSNQKPLVVDVIFHSVGGNVGYINAQGFVAACSLLDVSAKPVYYPKVDTAMDRLKLKLEKLIRSAWCSTGLDVFVLLMALVDLIVDSSGNSQSKKSSAEFALSIFIFVIFLVEMFIKWFALGIKRYWEDWLNRIDLLVILMTIGSFFASATVADDTRLRIMLFLRLARLLRLLHRIPAVKNVIVTVLQISPLFWRIIVVLFITMYCLAVIGVEAFSGKLDPSNPNIQQSSYGINKQLALNYDTFTRSLMAQFAVLITTQSPIILEGLMAGTSSWWPALYISISYVLIVCVVSNILIALLLQSYGISSSHTRHRQTGFVEIWEHLLARAQLDLYALDSKRYTRPILFTFRRRNAFMTVNENLFGESLSLDFEVDADEMELQRQTVALHRNRQAVSTHLTNGHSNILVSVAQSFFGNLVSGLQAVTASESMQIRGFSSLRVHSQFDPVAFATNEFDNDARLFKVAAVAQLQPSGGRASPSTCTITRSLTEFVRSALVLDDAKLQKVALNVLDLEGLRGEGSRPRVSSEHQARESASTLGTIRAMTGPGPVPQTAADSALHSDADDARSHRLRRIAALAMALASEQEALRDEERTAAAREIASGQRRRGADSDPATDEDMFHGDHTWHAPTAPAGRSQVTRPLGGALNTMRRMFSQSSLNLRSGQDYFAEVTAHGSPLLDSEMVGIYNALHPTPSRKSSALSADDTLPTTHRRLRSATILGETVQLHAPTADPSYRLGEKEAAVVVSPDGYVFISDK